MPERDDACPEGLCGSENAYPTIEIYRIRDIRRALKETDAEPFWENENQSSEEMAWRRRLIALRDDPRSSFRSILIADRAMIEDVEALKSQAPHFTKVIDLVLRAARLSREARAALSIPPLLLLGAPGIGKSYFAQKLAEALGTRLERVAIDLMSDRGTMTGLSISQKAARPGRIATGLIESKTASPIFLLDEVDKASALHAAEQPLAFLHSVLEPENSVHYTDEYYTIPMRADHAIWVLTANGVTGLSPSILDRLLVIELDEPTLVQQISVFQSIYAQVNKRHNSFFEEKLSEGAIAGLLGLTPRMVRKVIELAGGFAKEAHRKKLIAEDIEASLAAIGHQGLQMRIGFL